jgi:hypothetical protein
VVYKVFVISPYKLVVCKQQETTTFLKEKNKAYRELDTIGVVWWEMGTINITLWHLI